MARGGDVRLPRRPFMESSCLLYADDLCLVASSPEPLSLAVQAIEDVGGKLGVHIAPEKSEVLWLSGRPADPPSVYLNNIVIPEKSYVDYLGVRFQHIGAESTMSDVSSRITKATIKLQRNRKWLKQKHSIAARSKWVCAKVLPTLWHGLEVSRLTSAKMKVNNTNRY